MSRKWNPIWPFTEEQRIINRCAMIEVPQTNGPVRLLQVSTDYFCAGAVWKKISGIWSCIHAAPIMRWMVGMTGWQAKMALLKMDAKFQWISAPNVTGAAHGDV